MPINILVTHQIHSEVLQRLKAFGKVDMNTEIEPWSYPEILRRAGHAQAMMGFMTDHVDRELLAAAPALKIIACALKGYDSYDVSACQAAGVWLSIVPDLLTEPTAELAIGLAISLARHVRHGDYLIRTTSYRGWRPRFYGKGLYNASVAVVGMGSVGRAIAKRLSGFDCKKIVFVDSDVKISDIENITLEAAMAAADFVFLAVPLTEKSAGMIGSTQLAQCKPGQFLINVGRGSVVNEKAVAVALESGRLGGYAADVFACEDWSLDGHPQEIPPQLLTKDQTLFTPHLGSAVQAVRLAIEHRAADNIIAVLEGRYPQDAIAGPMDWEGGIRVAF
jgi:phosphonate dehydrogenase